MRTTRADMERVTRDLAAALDLPPAHYREWLETTEGGPPPEDRYRARVGDGRWIVTAPGGLDVDYNPAYGGAVIAQIAPDGGTWETRPFGDRRRPPGEYVEYVRAILAGIAAERRRRGDHREIGPHYPEQENR